MQILAKSRYLACLLLVLLCTCCAVSAANPPHHTPRHAEAGSTNEPTWLRNQRQPSESTGEQPAYHPLRSLIALVLIVSGLFAVQYFLRRRMSTSTPQNGSKLRILSRHKIGLRQELLVVAWKNEEILIGVGPTPITRLATHDDTLTQDRKTNG